MYLADIDHIEDARLVPHPPEYEDVFDPTFCGKYLGFEVQKRNSSGQWIYWWDRAAKTTQQIDLPTTAGLVGAPHCSPDGHYIAYTDLTVRPWKLTVVDLSDGNIALKHAAGTLAGFASWNSNNTDLYDMTFANSIYSIEQIQAFSTITNVALNRSDGGAISSAYYPAISPDGKTLAFICRVPAGFDLCVTRPESNDAHILDSVSGVKYKGFTLPFGTPSWSPDGEWIYYSSQSGGNLDIFRIRADGTGRENMTPDWSSNEIQPTIAW